MASSNGFFGKPMMLMLALWACGDALGAQCSDGIDNDSDGRVDMASPYCKLPDDNDESSFRSNVPGDDGNLPRSLDTFFDLNGGTGDDSCSLHACCMITGACPADMEPGFFNPSLCIASVACVDNTKPAIQPGCDAFGCCDVFDAAASTYRTVFVNPAVSPDCTLNSLGDAASCRACAPNPDTYVPIGIFINGFE